MPRSPGSEQRSGGLRLPLALLAAASLGSGLLFAAMPTEGLASSLRLLSLLPVQLAALLWVLPRMR